VLHEVRMSLDTSKWDPDRNDNLEICEGKVLRIIMRYVMSHECGMSVVQSHVAMYHVARNHVAMCESCHLTHMHTYTHAHTLHVAMDHIAMCGACHMTEACLLCRIMSHIAPSYAALCIPRPLMNKRHDNTEICQGNVSRMRVSHVT